MNTIIGARLGPEYLISLAGRESRRTGLNVINISHMLIVSHRCLGYESAENSIGGLARGLHSAVDQIEIDLRLTSDHHYVALHFPYYFTRKGRLRLISGTSLQRARQDSLPSLDEILTTFELAGTPKVLRLEVKVPGREAELVNELRRRQLISKVTVVSWSIEILERFRLADAEIRLCYSFIEGYPSPARIRRIAAERINLDSICIMPSFSRIQPRLIERYCRTGVPVFLAATVGAHEWTAFERAGVAGMLTKTPLTILAQESPARAAHADSNGRVPFAEGQSPKRDS